MLILWAREVCKKFLSYCVLGVFHRVQLQAWEPCSPMEDSNKFTKYCVTTTPQVLKSLCVPMLQRKNRVHVNVCGMLSPHSTCRERFSCNNQQTIKFKKNLRFFLTRGFAQEKSWYFSSHPLNIDKTYGCVLWNNRNKLSRVSGPRYKLWL